MTKKSIKKRPNKVLDNIVWQIKRRARNDIQKWQAALSLAENPFKQRRFRLYEIYDDIMLDAHLTAEIQKRTLAVTGASFKLTDQKGNISDKTQLLRKNWFDKLLKWIIETRFYGHSLIQISEIDNGEITQLELIPRGHIVPEQSLFLKQPNDDKGINYNAPEYKAWLIEIGEKKDLGLLNKAVPHVLFKRFAQSAWSEFTEIFGMPIRIAKTNTKDRESLNRMEQMMLEMSTAFYAIIDNDEMIEFVESAKSNGEVYGNLIKLANAEVSKLINGSVIGQDSHEGSRAKEQVGKDITDQIHDSDRAWIEKLMNQYILPKLIDTGYPFQGLTFGFDKEPDTQNLWKITEGILNHYDVDPEFIKNTFGIPVTGKKQTSSTLRTDDFFD